MRWVDIYDIVIALDEQHPDVDILGIRFTDLQQWILNLPGFSDDVSKCNEKVLEAIQMAWLDERS